MNIRIGRISKALTPSYSWCKRCQTTWPFVDYHITQDEPYTGSGCFPLCEKCWQQLGTPEERWPYYVQLLAEWNNDNAEERREAIRRAVFAGR